MKVAFRPLAIEDLEMLEVRPEHASDLEKLRALGEDARPALETPYSWTAWCAYGVPVACAGIYQSWAWALLSERAGRRVAISRFVAAVLLQHNEEAGPVYAEVDPEFAPALRWARLLGFWPSGPGRVWTFDAGLV